MAGKGAGVVLWFLLLLFSFGVQSLTSLMALVRAQGSTSLQRHAPLLASLQIACLMTLAIGSRPASDRDEGDEATWLSTLPAPAWVLHGAKLGEAALLNPVGWLLLFPFFNSVAILSGLGVLAPVVALVVSLPLLACGAMLRSVVEAAPVTVSRSLPFRVLRALGPLLGSLVVLFWLGESMLRMAGVDVWGWLSHAPELAWLPFSEPARALVSWRTAPLAAVAWAGLFIVEVALLLVLGTLLLRQTYRADLVLGRDSRRGVRVASPLGQGGARGGAPRRLLGGVARQELLWLWRSPAQGLRLLLCIGLFNGLGWFVARRAPDVSPAALPSIVLFGVGVLLLVAQAPLLERERTALWHWAALPRPMSWVLLRKTSFMLALTLLGALPMVIYTFSALPRPMAAVAALVYAGAALVSAAFLQTALWFRHVSPEAATSQSRHTTRTLQLWFFTGWLGVAGVMPFAAQPTLHALPPLVVAAALVWTLWNDALSRAPFVLDPAAPEPRVPTAAFAIITLVLWRDWVAAGWAEGLRRGLPVVHVAVFSILFASLTLLPASLLWLKLIRDVSGLRARLGLVPGKGLVVILREGLLWCVPAIAINLANAFVVGRFSAVTSSPMVSQPDLMLALRASPFALVSVACIVAPIVEEVLYRGLLFSALRPRHGVAIALLGSATLFALHHPVAQIVPTLAVGAFTTLAFVRSRSLYAAILVHVLCNGFSVGLQLYFPSP